MIIDIHAHTSNRPLYGLATESATIYDLEKEAKKYGVSNIMLMTTYFPLKKSGVGNLQMLLRIAGHPKFKMFGSLNVEDNFATDINELDYLAKYGMIAGLKLYPGYQDFDPNGAAVRPVYEIARKYHLPVAFHSGSLHHCCGTDENGNRKHRCGRSECMLLQRKEMSRPVAFIEAIKAYSDVKFLIAHMGNPYFDDMIETLEKCPNASTDMSGQFVSGGPEDTPEYKEIVRMQMCRVLALPNGSDRLLFGTDFPIMSYKDAIELVQSLDLFKEDEEKIFYHNAARLLNWEV